jgi:hypothetical protein
MQKHKIPTKAIVEARNALCDKHIALVEGTESKSIFNVLLKKRIRNRAFELSLCVDQIDRWLKEVGV